MRSNVTQCPMQRNQTQAFADKCGLLSKRLDRGGCTLIFQRVKVGKKETINFERFKVKSKQCCFSHQGFCVLDHICMQEAFRQIATATEVTYAELVDQICNN